MKKLDKLEIQERVNALEYWHLDDDALVTTLEFKNFTDAFTIMTRIAFEAESQKHHPDWHNVYNSLTIRLNTHDAGGITEKDFKLAVAIEQIIEGR